MKFKVRLVTQEFSQIYEVNYQKTFALTVHRELLRMFLTLMTSYNLKFHQMNIKAVYLSEELKCERENIYMCVLKSVTVTDSDKMTY